jgi:hypothetical protein
MKQFQQISLVITVIIWATLMGAIAYSNTIVMTPYLTHLPESTSLVTGSYGLQDSSFWDKIHPAAILTFLLSLVLNWKSPGRKFMLIAGGIYVIAIIATFAWFVPELKEFANSHLSSIPASEWLRRGQTWRLLSLIRGIFMYLAFILILVALVRNSRDSK